VFASFFYDHLSDFLQPDFRFGILLSFIATISWALEVYTLRKAATFNPYFSLGLQMLISSLILLPLVQLELESI
jgi:drug/metabolite transporter (DMT)-like permease